MISDSYLLGTCGKSISFNHAVLQLTSHNTRNMSDCPFCGSYTSGSCEEDRNELSPLNISHPPPELVSLILQSFLSRGYLTREGNKALRTYLVELRRALKAPLSL